MTKVIIDRATWDRGTNEGKLLRRDGRRCALGFVALACAIPDELILLEGFPSETAADWPDTIVHKEARKEQPVANKIICANDDPGVSDSTREVELTRLFAEAGLELEFVGEGKP